MILARFKTTALARGPYQREPTRFGVPACFRRPGDTSHGPRALPSRGTESPRSKTPPVESALLPRALGWRLTVGDGEPRECSQTHTSGQGDPPDDVAMTMLLAPRVLRHRDAPAYLGMDRNRFDAEVRPALTEIPIGDRGIAFDRSELDAWIEAYIAQRGRPSRARKGETPCELGQKGSSSSGANGSSTSSILVTGSSSASARSRRMTQKPGFGASNSKSTTSGQGNFEQALIACGQMGRQST